MENDEEEEGLNESQEKKLKVVRLLEKQYNASKCSVVQLDRLDLVCSKNVGNRIEDKLDCPSVFVQWSLDNHSIRYSSAYNSFH